MTRETGFAQGQGIRQAHTSKTDGHRLWMDQRRRRASDQNRPGSAKDRGLRCSRVDIRFERERRRPERRGSPKDMGLQRAQTAKTETAPGTLLRAWLGWHWVGRVGLRCRVGARLTGRWAWPAGRRCWVTLHLTFAKLSYTSYCMFTCFNY